MQDLYGATWTPIDYIGTGLILLIVAILFFAWGYCRGVDNASIANSEVRDKLLDLKWAVDKVTGETPPTWARGLVSENNSMYQHTFKMGIWREKPESVAPIPKMSDYHRADFTYQQWYLDQGNMHLRSVPPHIFPTKHSKCEPIVTQTAGAPHQPTVDYIVNKLSDPILHQDQV